MHSANQKPGKPDMVSQDAVAYTNYPSIQSANQKPGKPDTLSQHAVETNHNMGKLTHYPSIHSASMLSQHTLCKLTCIKETAKAQNSRQADTARHCTTRRTRARGAAVHLGRLGKRHEE